MNATSSKRIKQKPEFLAVMLIAAVCGGSAQGAAPILYDVQFTDSTRQSGAAVLGSSSDPLWNNGWQGTNPTSSAEQITSTNGLHTAALTFNGDYGGIYSETYSLNGAPNPAALMGAYLFSTPGNGGIQFNVTGLTPGTYDLVVYAAGNQAGQGSVDIVANSTQIGSTSAATGNINSGVGVAYAEGHVIVGSDGNFGAYLVEAGYPNPTSNDYTALNGFQLEMVPEPASLALCGAGAMLLLRRRRAAV